MVYLQADSLYEYIIMVTLRYKTSHVNQKYIDFVVFIFFFWGEGLFIENINVLHNHGE